MTNLSIRVRTEWSRVFGPLHTTGRFSLGRHMAAAARIGGGTRVIPEPKAPAGTSVFTDGRLTAVPDIPVTATIGFELRGQPGRVVIRYGLNEDPDRWGYPLLGLKPLTEVSRGFPVVQAEVVHPAEGYGAVLSWIQIIRSTNGESAERMHYVDRAPQLEGLDLPYYSFGMRPILFDAPSTTAREMSWNAHALLAVSPDCVISRRVQALCGFAWGYRVVGGQPRPAPLTVFGSPAAWREDLEFLGSRHPLWSFC